MLYGGPTIKVVGTVDAVLGMANHRHLAKRQAAYQPVRL
jgi:hypothetical protein